MEIPVARAIRAINAMGTIRAVRSLAAWREGARAMRGGLWRRSAVGIDVGTGAVKVVALSRGPLRGDLRLEQCALEPCGTDGTDNGDLRASQGAALKRALRCAGVRVRQAVLGVPDRSIRCADVVVAASLTPQERRWEAEDAAYALFPLPDAPCFDVVQYPVGHGREVGLHVVATSTDVVAARTAVAAAAGASVAVLDFDAFAMGRALAFAGAAATDASCPLMVADLGAWHPAVMMRKGPVAWISVPLQGASVGEAGNDVRALAAAIAVASAAAIPAVTATGPAVAAAPNHAARLGSRPHMVLAGGRAALPGLREAVAASTGLTTAIANPFARIAAAPEIDGAGLAPILPAYLLATGLALRGLQ